MFLISSKPRSACHYPTAPRNTFSFQSTTRDHRISALSRNPDMSDMFPVGPGHGPLLFPPFRAGLSRVGDILYKSQGSQRLGRKVSFAPFHGQGFPARLARTRGKGDFGLLPGCGPPVIALERSTVPVPQLGGRFIGAFERRKGAFRPGLTTSGPRHRGG